MIFYQTTTTGITPANLNGFFVGWPNPPTPATHMKILRQSSHVVLAIDDSTGQVVGFINAVSDGILTAYLPLVEVLPAYQFSGIGAELVRRMLEQLKDYYMIDLISRPDLQRGYETFGFQRAAGMAIRNFAYQSGRPEEVDNDPA